MSRIQARFEAAGRAGDGALIVFVVAGHPNVKTSAGALLAIADAGADIIELGVPFSDPLADGPVIQEASQAALRQRMSPQGVLEMAAEFRRARDLPLVLMTCYNPIWRFGVESFAREAASAGVDGVIVTDLPPEESEQWVAAARANDIDTIFLLAPTSPIERVKGIAELATGFVYCVSRMGVTGARTDLPPELKDLVGRVRSQTEKPVAVGFGISQPEHVAEVCRMADGAVVGSAVVSLLERSGPQGLDGQSVGEFVAALKAATRGVRKAGPSR